MKQTKIYDYEYYYDDRKPNYNAIIHVYTYDVHILNIITECKNETEYITGIDNIENVDTDEIILILTDFAEHYDFIK